MLRFIVSLYLFFCCLTAALPTTAAAEKLRFGVISINHPLVMYRQYLPFTDFIQQQLGTEVELVLAADYQGIVDALAEGRVDIALVAGVSYLKAQEVAEMRILCAVRSREGTPTSQSVFVVRSDRDDLQALKDLKGHSFAFGSVNSTSSYLWPLGYLLDNGIYPEDFSHWQNLKTHDAVIRALLRGTFDAGVISTEALGRFSDDSFRVVATTSRFPGFVLASTSNVSEELHSRLQDLLLNLDYQEPEVADSVKRWSPLLREGFIKVDKDHYGPVQALLETLEAHGFYGARQ